MNDYVSLYNDYLTPNGLRSIPYQALKQLAKEADTAESASAFVDNAAVRSIIQQKYPAEVEKVYQEAIEQAERVFRNDSGENKGATIYRINGQTYSVPIIGKKSFDERLKEAYTELYKKRFPGDWVPQAARLAAGLLEVADGVLLLLAPEPTGATKVAGVLVIAHGIDTTVAAGRSLANGDHVQTLTQGGIARVLRGVGVSDKSAEVASGFIDAGVPLILTAGAAGVNGALRKLQAKKPPLPRAEADVRGVPRFNPNVPAHVNAAQAEKELAEIVHSLPDQVVVHWGSPIGAHGADVISVNQRTGAVTFWDAKFRSGKVTIQPSPTFKANTDAMKSAINDAIKILENNKTLPANIRQAAISNLNQGNVSTRTVGFGNAKNSTLK